MKRAELPQFPQLSLLSVKVVVTL